MATGNLDSQSTGAYDLANVLLCLTVATSEARMRRNFLSYVVRSILLLALLFMCPMPGAAEVTTAIISGRVMDESITVLPVQFGLKVLF